MEAATSTADDGNGSLGCSTTTAVTTTSTTTAVATPAVLPRPSHIQSPGATPPAKILGRNLNGTLVLTSTPGNEAELQLYRVMQRASLLAYYDILLEMGGDDVQQLCDAGEEEFLEIMALVGMAQKPLHVRRLQKALQEWVSNPAMFQVPLLSPVTTTPITFPLCPRTITISPQPVGVLGPSPPISNNHTNKEPQCLPSPGLPQNISPEYSNSNSKPSPSPVRVPGPSTSPVPVPPGSVCSPGSPVQLTPVLMESQIARLAEAADHLVRSLPQFEPRPQNSKKKICKDLEYVMSMSEDDPRRMEEIRKYAAIYGRFDCKRKPEKPLTLHEVSVNEAAAQICRFAPALLTRRDELFPLARQVVRDSGYIYSKGHTNMSGCYKSQNSGCGGKSGIYNNGDDYPGAGKRQRLDSLPPSPGDTSSDLRRQERLAQICEELRLLSVRTEELVIAAQQVRELHNLSALHSLQQQLDSLQRQQAQLLMEQTELMRQQQQLPQYNSSRYCKRGNGRTSAGPESERPDTDDGDSQFSFSNTSSPSQEVGDSRDSIIIHREFDNGNFDHKDVARNSCKISKQMVNDTLLDEGLRVVKEMVNKESSSSDLEDSFSENKIQVIASSGGNIIAVANPALSMSPALPDGCAKSLVHTTSSFFKREPSSPVPSPISSGMD